MSVKKHNTPLKLFVIRTYQSLSQIETVISHITQQNNIPFQLSILGKLTTNKTIAKKELKKIMPDTKQQLSAVLGKKFQVGYFNNPEIGTLFIAGHLTPTFLNKIDERELASLPTGLIGIFKGLGINTEEINSYLNELKNDNYCLIIRGESSVLAGIEPMLSGY
ncbi:hypothetical protein ADIWIN_2511 [Winogradskyella psychrotolerans RS-3]|uniref:Uncharacterized protein n=1 Tax=Winogradskyella psychrotolerans RS-3 TaxID=641526 RepID=S7VQS3_9FLAO|nr:hypothetical protein [Winogradskyella psychrotolerans]EPR72341.1 hypothetical protein ADIWIN_2511 [Winogradskyella psychrotolerans RS-3]